MAELQTLDYFYDRQQLRFIEQIIRAFSGIQYMSGARAGLDPQLMTVPCRMATTNQTVASILRNQSENTLLVTPMITVWQTDLKLRPEDLQNRNHIGSLQVVERAIDPDTGSYTNQRGQGYNVQRLMPIPFNMMIEIDIWTSNLDQKYQIQEQICASRVPSFDIQNSENALDWTAMTTMYLEDMTHTSRTIPVGTDAEIDVMSFTYRLPIWITPPAKVKELRQIHQVVTNIGDAVADTGVIVDADVEVGQRYVQDIVTPGDHHISVDGGIISLLGPHGVEKDKNDQPFEWLPLLNRMGFLRPAVSTLSLYTTTDIEGPSVVGTLQASSDPNKLIWQINSDTLPANTLSPVNALIDPLKHFPGQVLPAPIEGQRYLILNDIGSSQAWGQIASATGKAEYGDIIQYHSGQWHVSFDASANNTADQYVLNLHTGTQYRFTGEDWVLAVGGTYGPGLWRLNL